MSSRRQERIPWIAYVPYRTANINTICANTAVEAASASAAAAAAAEMADLFKWIFHRLQFHIVLFVVRPIVWACCLTLLHTNRFSHLSFRPNSFFFRYFFFCLIFTLVYGTLFGGASVIVVASIALYVFKELINSLTLWLLNRYLHNI